MSPGVWRSDGINIRSQESSTQGQEKKAEGGGDCNEVKTGSWDTGEVL